MLEERDPHGWILKALREAGSSLLSEFHGLDENQLRWRPVERRGTALTQDEWCLKEIAAHLRDAEELALAQLTHIAQGAREPLPAWDVDALPQERDYAAEDLADLLTEFRRLRRETAYLLWGLTEADWQRSGQHLYRGPVTLEELARELAQHDLEHLWQVRRLKEMLRAAVASREDE